MVCSGREGGEHILVTVVSPAFFLTECLWLYTVKDSSIILCACEYAREL